MSFGGLLRQSTAVDVKIGPFVDSTDGDAEETGLTIEDSDVILSKNGQTGGAKADVTTCAHAEDGMYNCELDTTDTNTVGQLTLHVHVAGALFVRHDFQVVEEAVYDASYAASAAGPNVVVPDAAGVAPTAVENRAEMDSNSTQFSAIVGDTNELQVKLVGITLLAEWLGAIMGKQNADSTALTEIKASGAGSGTYDPNTDSTEGLKDALTTLIATAQSDLDKLTGSDGATLATAQGNYAPAKAGDSMDCSSISGDSTAADLLEAMMDGMRLCQVNDASATTTAFAADQFTEATDDHFKGRLITFITGNLAGQQTDIVSYDAAGGAQGSQEFTVTALTEAPANDDFFIIH